MPSATSSWRPVVVETSVIVKGGYNPQGSVASSVTYAVGQQTFMYIELSKNAKWFLRGVSGPQTRVGDLKHVKVLGMIRELFQCAPDVTCGDRAGVAAVADAAGADPVASDDPMDEMDDVGVAAPPSTTPPKKVAKKSTTPISLPEFRRLDVPLTPPCTNARDAGVTSIWVYRRPVRDIRQNGVLFLRSDGVAWLLDYAARELACQGVEAHDPVPAPDMSPNWPAVAGLRLEYDFSARAWSGTFVEGPFTRTTRRMCVDAINKAVWQKLRDASIVQGYLSRASSLERKLAVKEFVAMLCESANRHDGRELEALLRTVRARGVNRDVTDTVFAANGADDAAVADSSADDAAPTAGTDDGESPPDDDDLVDCLSLIHI